MLIEVHKGTAIERLIPDLSALRVQVFAEWPYLYEGSAAQEEKYLHGFAQATDAVLVTASISDRIVGAATGCAFTEHTDARKADLSHAPFAPTKTFYCAESVLLPDWRGHGVGHAFFDAREDHAKACGYHSSVFCAVERPSDHPLKPAGARALAPFWEGRGYRRLDGVTTTMDWRDRGDLAETVKTLTFWGRHLNT
ncbi:GNAT family N-acetyltransferase [Parvularcula sp. LCG005]|uniref:GNAT family N-acetyltransferase n=1 Tax=Parvularcula sp. LCG005 TaxID=3078805 RepID=UPI00294386B8|nr:GNAT family N-acetyltransferase [Parvularcula sp. LCG005]WOI53730.1 GNAT family N-acetyltransferase [Parvularcula sp. LCG005]